MVQQKSLLTVKVNHFLPCLSAGETYVEPTFKSVGLQGSDLPLCYMLFMLQSEDKYNQLRHMLRRTHSIACVALCVSKFRLNLHLLKSTESTKDRPA